MSKKKSNPTIIKRRNSEAIPNLSLRSIGLVLLTIGVVAVFVYYIYSNRDKYINLINISSKAVLYLLLISLLSLVVNGLISTILFQGLGIKLSYKNGFNLASASTLANQLPISGGMITRGVYLKRMHNLSYTKFFSTSLALFICFVSVNGLIGIVILLYRLFYKNILVSPYIFIGFLLMFAALILFLLPLDKIRFPEKIQKNIIHALEGWEIIRKNPMLVLKLVGLQICLMLLLSIRYWLAFNMLSQDVNVGDVILFSSASVLTQLVSIAPGGLGVTEAIVGSIASALGFEMGVSVVAVGLDRLVSTFVILLVGGISTVILGRQVAELPLTTNTQEEGSK